MCEMFDVFCERFCMIGLYVCNIAVEGNCCWNRIFTCVSVMGMIRHCVVLAKKCNPIKWSYGPISSTYLFNSHDEGKEKNFVVETTFFFQA